MLTEKQLNNLTEQQLNEYNAANAEEKAQFEYFYGFTFNNSSVITVTKKETELYQRITDTIKLKSVAQLLDFIPHMGQQPIFYTFDERKDLINNLVMVLGRRTGKSASTSVIAIRELLVPFSATILLVPTFSNAKIIFNDVLKHVQQLKLPIKSINKGSFQFELENGARFSANSESNVESALGSSLSLLLVDESQSFSDLNQIVSQMLSPMLLDYGMRSTGVLYGRQIYLGTPRGTDNYLYDLYEKQNQFPNWKSFNAPSTTNPILPTSYFETMRLELGEMLYNQEILAQFIGTGNNVFYAFNKESNTYERGSVVFSSSTPTIVGLDIGARDSTAHLILYRTPDGSYYLDQAYSKNMTSTKAHVQAYLEQEQKVLSVPEMRYIDPSAAQARIDLITDYNYECVPANNDIQDSIKYLNVLLSKTGANDKPKLFICSDLTEVIRQVSRVMWKDSANKSSKDPYVKDPKGTHWDIIAALRYAVYSDRFNVASSFVMLSEKSNNSNNSNKRKV